MGKLLLILVTSLSFASTIKSNDSLYIYSVEPIIAAEPASTSNGLNKVYEDNHLIYLIIVGLLAAISALVVSLKILWKREEKLTQKIDDLNLEKLEIALESANIVKDSIEVIKSVNTQILKLAENDIDRKLYDNDLRNIILNMSSNVDDIIEELEKLHQKCNN